MIQAYGCGSLAIPLKISIASGARASKTKLANTPKHKASLSKPAQTHPVFRQILFLIPLKRAFPVAKSAFQAPAEPVSRVHDAARKEIVPFGPLCLYCGSFGLFA